MAMATEIIAESTKLGIIAESVELGIIVGYSALRGEYWTIRGEYQTIRRESCRESLAKTAVVICRATPSEEDGKRIPSVAELISSNPVDSAGDSFIIEAVYRHNAPPV
jgi:hypothetical protein